MTTISNQVFNVGDYVRTSKGKIGVIEKPERWYIVEEDGTPVYTDLDPNRTLEDITNNVLSYWIYGLNPKTHGRKAVKVPNAVKLGNKTYPIWSDKLTKLDKLRVKMQQGFSQIVIELPVADAKVLIELLNRNKIWFYIL